MINIPKEEETIINAKIFISNCKKNGILLQKTLGYNIIIDDYLYDTTNFEVYCLCQLIIVQNLNVNKNLDNIK